MNKFNFSRLSQWVAAAFIAYMAYAAFYPIELPKYTITNGEKTIVFQSMTHIASEDFYKNVESDIVSYTNNGYVFLFEGVRPSKFHKDSIVPDYSDEASSLGLVDQGSGNYYRIAIDKGYDADIDEDELRVDLMAVGILRGLDDLAGGPKVPTKEHNVKLTGAAFEIEKFIGLAASRIGYRFSMMLNSAEVTENDPVDYVIVNLRNKYLLECVYKVKGDKIYINYGAAHFPNFLKQLQEKDPRWHVESSSGGYYAY